MPALVHGGHEAAVAIACEGEWLAQRVQLGLGQRPADAARLQQPAQLFGGHRMQSLEVGGARRKNQHRAGGCVHQQRERLAVDEVDVGAPFAQRRSEEHTSELQSLMRTSYAVFCLKKKNKNMSQD